MRTLTIEKTVYNHSDLLLPENKHILEKIVSNWNDDYYYIWNEAHESVKGFHKFFGNITKEGNRNWLDYSLYVSDFEEELKGKDLKEWFLENFNQNEIFECCPLTSVWYDETLLTPFRSFLLETYKDFENTTLGILFDDAFSSLSKCIYDEIEYRNNEEAILETICANAYEYDEDGKLM